MPILEMEQGSPEWLSVRVGRVTGSRLMDVMAYKEDGSETQKRADYRMDLVAERLTGLAEGRYVSTDMKWGTAHEPDARRAYEAEADELVVPVGFAIHPEMDFTGASPDSLIGETGILEIKCPKTTTHIQYLRSSVVPEKYRAQMTWEMICCERGWGDFVSYDPRMPEDLQLFIVRYELDRDLARKIETEVWKFNQEVEAEIAALRGADTHQMTLNDRLRASLALLEG